MAAFPVIKASSRSLRKSNISWLGVVFMLYCLVCAGAFGIEEMIPAAGPGMTLILLLVLPIIWAFPISAQVSECNAILPKEGGIYVWVREAFGEFWGFQAGWWNAISIYISSGTYVSLTAAYVTQLIPLDDFGLFVVKLLMVALFTAINLVGLKQVEHAGTILSVLVIAMFAAIAVLGFMNWQTNPMVPLTPTGSIVDSLSEGLAIGIWMFCGYECIVTMSEEIGDWHVVSRGLRVAMPLIALSYLLPTIASLASLPEGSWELWSVSGGLEGGTVGYATVLQNSLGFAGMVVFCVVAIASQCAIYNTYLASGSRSFFVLAEDKLFPRFAGLVDKEGRSPYLGIFTIALSSLLFSQLDFTTLVEMEIVFILAEYMILSVTVVRLRKMYPEKQRREQGRYLIPGGRFGYWYCVALPFAISVFALLIEGPEYLGSALVALSSGPLFYVIFKRRYGGLSEADPKRYPLDLRSKLTEGDGRRILLFVGFMALLVVLEALFAILFL